MRLPPEIMADVLTFFDRNWLEKLEMVGRTFRDLIRRQFDGRAPFKDITVQFQFQFYRPDRYECSLWFSDASDLHGPIERFVAFLRRHSIAVVAADFTAEIDIGCDFYPEDYPLYSDEVKQQMLSLQPVWLRAQRREVSLDVTFVAHPSQLEFIKTALTWITPPELLPYSSLDPQDSSAAGTLSIPPAIDTSTRIEFRVYGVGLIYQLAEDAELSALISRCPFESTLSVKAYSDEAVYALEKLYESWPRVNPIRELDIALTGVSNMTADEMIRYIRFVFLALTPLYDRIQFHRQNKIYCLTFGQRRLDVKRSLSEMFR